MKENQFNANMKVAIHWFRKGLRLHDNPALVHASQESVDLLIPLYIINTEGLSPSKIAYNPIAFLLECLENLNANLKRKGLRLFVALGDPAEVLSSIIKHFKVDLLTFEVDDEPHGKKRDAEISLMAKKLGVKEVASFCSHTLYDLSYLLEVSGGKPPLTMPVFLSALSNADPPPKPVDIPKTLPKAPTIKQFHQIKRLKIFDSTPKFSDLSEFGYETNRKTTYFVGGEDEGIQRMEKFLSQKRRVAKYEKPKTLPTSIEPESTALSPYIKFGCLSVRLFLKRIKDVYESCGRDHTKPPVSLEGQLYWREMSYLIACCIPNFDKQVGNPVSKQLDWHTGPEAVEILKKWEMGETGIPSVDAVMNQLRVEGWMHHLARHLVSCFLTRGDLWLHWEAGREIFDKYLIDSDYSLNNFNWHWMSCSALFHQYFRCHKPATFFKNIDPEGNYVRRHIPVLKYFPDEFIYEPWLAPIEIQRKARCIIGEDYPKPIHDHTTASRENMNKMKVAFEEAKKNFCMEESRRVSFSVATSSGIQAKRRRLNYNKK